MPSSPFTFALSIPPGRLCCRPGSPVLASRLHIRKTGQGWPSPELGDAFMPTAAPSIAEAVFKQIQEMDSRTRVAFVQKYVTDHQEETDWLDFKAGSQIKDVNNSPFLMKNWSKYLSAFANSGGGLL